MPATIGDTLRDARRRRGLSIDELASATKVPVHHLRALEGNRFDNLPGNVFAKGYVRSYADAVGLDPARTVATFVDQCGEPDPEAAERAGREAARAVLVRLGAEAPGSVSERSAAVLKVGAGIAVAAAIAMAGWWVVGRDDGRGADEPAEVASLTGTAQSRTVEAPTTDEPTTDEPTTRQPAHSEPSPSPVQAAPERTVAPEPSATAPERSAPTRVTSPPPDPSPPPASAADSALRIAEHGVGTGVQRHRLVGESDHFDVGTDVVFWTDIVGGTRGDTIVHVWSLDGRAVSRVSLKVGGPRWRTYSRKALNRGSEGDWTVEARDAEGHVLARSTFRCVSDN